MYRDDFHVARFLGRTRVLVNAPDAIHRVLVDNPGNYRRTPASLRVLRPIAGDGLLLSEGAAWKMQRRTIAPALAPRTIPVLARHIAAVAAETVAALRRQALDTVDLAAEMQRVALDIAGRSMFSLDMTTQGVAMRTMLDEYAQRYAQPYMLDLLLPLRVPAPRDFGRRRFARRWARFMDGLIAPRLATPPPAVAADLLDLLRQAAIPRPGRRSAPPSCATRWPP